MSDPIVSYVAQSKFPHDDTNSLVTFYDKPWLNSNLLTHVVPPFVMRYETAPVHGILCHNKVADALATALRDIWDYAGHSQDTIDAWRISKYSGSYNYRAVRGAVRLSCHAFGAAFDFDAEGKPLGHKAAWPDPVVRAFKNSGATWGGDFISRKDPMHFQYAREF